MMAIKKLRTRQDLHLSRKVWHVLTVGFMAVTFHSLPKETAIIFWTLVGVVFIGFDLFRQKNPKANAFALRVVGPLMRDTEVSGLAGTTWLIVGVLLVAIAFPTPVVVLSLLFLAFADPLASFIGILYGKDKIFFGRKSVQGTFAGFLVCVILSFGYFGLMDMMTERLLLVSLLAGLIGSLSEAIPIAGIDDNFVMPVLSSIGLWGLISVFGGVI